MLCQPRPEPIARKQKAIVPVPPPQKIGKKRRRARGSSSSGDPTSTGELALAKALKSSKKFSSWSSGLSLAEKASAANIGTHRGKKLLPHTGVSDAGMTSKALDLFRSASSASKDEATAPAPRQKCPRKFPPKTSRKSSDVPPMKGTSIQRCSIPFYFL
jgi:hypothetical protein